MARQPESNIPPLGEVEATQPRIIQLNGRIRKDDLTLFQNASDAITRAGLGSHRYTVAEKQIDPDTGKPIEEGSPFVIVTYSGYEDRAKLFEVIIRAKDAKRDAEQEGRPPREIDQAVQNAITTAVNLELEQEKYFRSWMNPSLRTLGK